MDSYRTSWESYKGNIKINLKDYIAKQTVGRCSATTDVKPGAGGTYLKHQGYRLLLLLLLQMYSSHN
jgi:hypothetical protein